MNVEHEVNLNGAHPKFSDLPFCYHAPFLDLSLSFLSTNKLLVSLIQFAIKMSHEHITLCEKSPYSEFFWFVFSCNWTEYGEIRSISLYSVQMRGNTDQKKSEYGHFSRSVNHHFG